MIDDLPVELRELVYRFHVQNSVAPQELRGEIRDYKLFLAFRRVIRCVTSRNAAWGVIYHVMTGNRDDLFFLRTIAYEQRVKELWDTWTNEQRDAFDTRLKLWAYYDDDGSLYIEWAA